MGEFAFGRMMQSGPMGAFDKSLQTKGKKGGKVLSGSRENRESVPV